MILVICKYEGEFGRIIVMLQSSVKSSSVLRSKAGSGTFLAAVKSDRTQASLLT